MEVVIVPTNGDGGVVADAVQRARRRPGRVLGLATGSSPLGGLPPAGAPCAEAGSASPVPPPSSSTSTSGCPGAPGGVPFGDPPRVHRPRRPRPPAVAAPTCVPPISRRRAPVRGCSRIPAASTSSSWAWAPRGHRVQRARVVAPLADPGEDADQPDRADNARFFASAEDVPRHVVTQGWDDLDARHVVLVAAGAARPSRWPGPSRARVTVWPRIRPPAPPPHDGRVDTAAAAGLKLADYYRAAWAGKPVVAGPVALLPGGRLLALVRCPRDARGRAPHRRGQRGRLPADRLVA